VPGSLGIRFTADGEKYRDTENHQHVWNASHKNPPLLT
jgi:hypothetical protein